MGRSSNAGSGGLDDAEILSGDFGESSGSGIWFCSSSLFSSADKTSSESDLCSTDLGDIFGERTGSGLSVDESEG